MSVLTEISFNKLGQMIGSGILTFDVIDNLSDSQIRAFYHFLENESPTLAAIVALKMDQRNLWTPNDDYRFLKQFSEFTDFKIPGRFNEYQDYQFQNLFVNNPMILHFPTMEIDINYEFYMQDYINQMNLDPYTTIFPIIHLLSFSDSTDSEEMLNFGKYIVNKEWEKLDFLIKKSPKIKQLVEIFLNDHYYEIPTVWLRKWHLEHLSSLKYRALRKATNIPKNIYDTLNL